MVCESIDIEPTINTKPKPKSKFIGPKSTILPICRRNKLPQNQPAGKPIIPPIKSKKLKFLLIIHTNFNWLAPNTFLIPSSLVRTNDSRNGK